MNLESLRKLFIRAYNLIREVLVYKKKETKSDENNNGEELMFFDDNIEYLKSMLEEIDKHIESVDKLIEKEDEKIRNIEYLANKMEEEIVFDNVIDLDTIEESIVSEEIEVA
ncbi:MAG: hypothetical protein N4A47_04890 [Clostridia bacterium]|jgi:aconitase B|nr:hypothetical protein [Clostridia bacterium]